MRRLFRGLDEMVIETAFVGLSALVFLVVLSWGLNSGAAHRLDQVPLVGSGIAGFRALVGQVVN